jgi:5-methylcytosine-specific restriction endonuclease McrA
MNLWLQAPYCQSCALSDPFLQERTADIDDADWQNDVVWKLGNSTLRRIKKELRKNSDFALICKRCGRELRPWEGNKVWVMDYHLEEHYGIPLETGGQKRPSARLRRKIIELYDGTCFGCGKTGERLHIDHIYPQSKGGDAAFRNLQLLCKVCGDLKGDDLPEEVDVWLDFYFGPYPSDGFEGLFW